MDCRAVRGTLVALHEQQLDLPTAEQVRSHLGACLPCRRLESRFGEIAPEPCLLLPPRVEHAFYQHLDPTALHALAIDSKRRNRKLMLATVVCSLLVLAGIGLFGLTNKNSAEWAKTGPTDEIERQASR